MSTVPRSDTLAPVVVVPCFNEERRLDLSAFAALADSQRVRLLFVDDGSTDGTFAALERLRAGTARVEVLRMPTNAGKAEAVRQGLLRGLAGGASIVGYYDADLATPPGELLRLLELLTSRPDLDVVLASRVALLGRRIQRHARRHYLGRAFGTLASIVLRVPVYDTQCGAKAFRVTPALRAALREPFRSTWVLDVELIGRLLRGSRGAGPVPVDAFEEMPLRAWRDVPGSRLTALDMARALEDLLVVGAKLGRGG